MPVIFTIKEVPDHLAKRLRERASAHHRSLHDELIAILEAAVREPPPAHVRKFALAELWERSRRLGPSSPNESTEIVRKLRDERHSR
jgi:plasmid stability protein